MTDKCPLAIGNGGVGFSCAECDAVEYSCHPSHNQNRKTTQEKLEKLIDDLQYVFDTAVHPEVKKLVVDIIGRVEDLKKGAE